MSSDRVHRVTVRGRFHQLTDEARRYLVTAQPEHDIFVSAFTAEGTFTYDERIAFFNLRYEIRGADDDAAVAPFDQARIPYAAGRADQHPGSQQTVDFAARAVVALDVDDERVVQFTLRFDGVEDAAHLIVGV